MQTEWTHEECLWARKCLAAGDTLEQVSAWGGRSVAEIERRLGLVRSGQPTPTKYLERHA